MSINDPISDMLATIRNGGQARLAVVSTPASKLRAAVLEVLRKEGYIRNYESANDNNGMQRISIELKYSDGKPAIQTMEKVSKPGRRVYVSLDELPRVYNGLGVAILSTSKGVLSDSEARVQKVGGELLCTVF